MFSLADLSARLQAYIARRDNPHEVNVTQIKSYSTTYLSPPNLDTVMVPMSGIPISRFGNLLWLPLSVSGSFEGATRNESRYFNAINVEPDGTPVILVNGTNGVKESVYYSYLRLDAKGAIVDHIPTGTEYRPPFFQQGWTATCVLQGASRGLVWGRLSGSPDYDGFLSLTNGTFNWVTHVGCPFKFPSGMGDMSWAVVAGNYIFAFCPLGGQHEFWVWRVPVVDILTKSSFTWEKITSINTIGVSKTYSSDRIKLAGVVGSKNPADDPIMLSAPDLPIVAFDTPGLVHTGGDVDPSTGLIHMNVWVALQYSYQFVVTTFAWYQYFTFDPSKMECAVDADHRGTTTISPITSQPGYVITGPAAVNYGQLAVGGDQQPHETIHVSDTGLVIKIHYPNENAGTIKTFRDTLFTKPWYFWNVKKRNLTSVSAVNFMRYYPSPLGDSNRIVTFIGPKHLCVWSTSNGSDIFNRIGTWVETKFQGGLDFNYDTAKYGLLKGYAPATRTDKRTSFKVGIITHFDDTGGVVAKGGRITTNELSTFTDVDSDLNYTGTVSITKAQHDVLIGQLTDMLPPGLYTAGEPAFLDMNVWQDTAVPVLIHLKIFHPTTNWVTDAVFSASVSNRVGPITSITPIRCVWSRLDKGTFARVQACAADQVVPAFLYHNKSENFYLLSVLCRYQSVASGSAPSVQIALLYRPGDNDFSTDFIKTGTSYNWYFGTNQWGVVPELGVGEYDMSANRALSGTSMVFRPVGKTLAQIKAWNLTGAVQYMIISQQVPAGWYCYITESVPNTQCGKYSPLLPATLNLTDVKSNPANSLFYVYVVDDGGTGFKYEVSETAYEDTYTRCFIGTIRTNASQIAETKLSKVTRLGKYRLSGPQIGGAVPAIPGLPTEPGVLTWNK